MLCYELDEYILNKDDPFWFITLTNGKTVFQDDERPGEEPKSAWLRLREYLQENDDVDIESMHIRFRSNVRKVELSGDGLYFSKGLLGAVGINCTFGTKRVNRPFYVVGNIHNNNAKIYKWELPALIMKDEGDIREVTKDNEQCVIWFKNAK